MFRFVPVCTAAATLLTTATGFAAPAGAEELRYKFEKGTVLQYVLKKTTKFSYKADSGRVQETETTEQTLDFVPQEVGTGGGGDLKVVFRKLKSARVSPELKYKFDSTKQYSDKAVTKEPMLGVLRGMMGDGYQARITSGGSVSAAGYGECAARGGWRGCDGNLKTGLIAGALVRAMGADTGLTHLLGLGFLDLPGDAEKGTAWGGKLQQTAAGIGFIHDFQYRIAALSKSKATIAIGGKYQLSSDGTVLPQEGTLKGTAAFDNTNGRLLLCKHSAAIKLPNVSMSVSYELKFAKAIPIADCGPASYERKLRDSQTLIARRTVFGTAGVPLPVYAAADRKETAFFTATGDDLRVIETQGEGPAAMHKVVTMHGRVGWFPEVLLKKPAK